MDTVKGAILAVIGAITAVLDAITFYLRMVTDAMRRTMENQGINSGLQTIVISVLFLVVIGLILLVTRGKLRLAAALLIMVIMLHSAVPALGG